MIWCRIISRKVGHGFILAPLSSILQGFFLNPVSISPSSSEAFGEPSLSSVKEIQVPFPGKLLADMVPLWSSMIFLVMARPSPVPPFLELRDESAL